MEISEVRVRLVADATERLKAVCSVTLDDEFVVRDVKLVEGAGGLFVAMPSRKLSAPCAKCRTQNHLRAKFCNECGARIPAQRIPSDENGREKAHRDVAHPITPSFRQLIQERVLEAYHAECGAGPDTDDEDVGAGYDRESESSSKASEYDTLIADLRGGEGGSRSGQTQEASADQPTGQRRRRRRRRGRRDDQGKEESRPEREREAVEFSAPVEQPAAPISEADRAAPVEVVSDERESSSEAWPDSSARDAVTDEPTQAPAAEHEPCPSDQDETGHEPVSRPDTDDPDDEGTPFGAGIL